VTGEGLPLRWSRGLPPELGAFFRVRKGANRREIVKVGSPLPNHSILGIVPSSSQISLMASLCSHEDRDCDD
jgi:hypothetical protein